MASPHPAATPQAAYVRIDRIARGVVWLTGGHAHAVLEVRRTGPAPRDAAAEGASIGALCSALNALDFPAQFVARSRPADLEGYARRFERAGARLGPHPLAEVAWDHAALARRLARGASVFEHRCYVAIPAPAEPGGAGRWRLPWRRTASGAAYAENQAVLTLDARCGDVTRSFARCDIAATRLDDAGLRDLFYDAWCPDLARVQRLPLPGEERYV
jgi:hypothetical protein